ncbi:ECF transporter S component [Fusibacter bizertensis]
MKNNLRALVYTALMTAFVFITTSIIKIPIPFTNGYIHAGDMCIFIAGILLGPFYGGFAAGVGSAMADFLGGYGQWVLPTFIIKTIMGMMIGYFAKADKNVKPYIVTAMLVWVSSLLTFLYTIWNTSVDTLSTHVDDIGTIEQAIQVIDHLKVQLLLVSIGIPVLVLFLGVLKRRYKVTMNQLVGMVLAGIWMVLGYYVASGLMYGNFIAPIFSIPWNIVQFGVGAVLAFMVVAALEKANVTHQTLFK